MRVTAATTIFLLASLRNPVVAEPLERKSEAVSIDLGTGVLGHGETSIGPFHAAHGFGDRVMVGSYTLPWATTVLAKGSVVPNLFVKLEAPHWRGYSAAIKSSLFWIRLNDIDDDEIKVRSFLWPTRVFLSRAWSPRWATTLEFTSVYMRATGAGLADNDTRVHGVAMANNYHVGAIQRLRVIQKLHLWARFRALLDHSPVLADGQATLSESVRIRAQARANSAELRSGYAAMGGIHWEWRGLSVLAGVGYGTWILPWVDLPVGKNTISAELDLSYRF